MREPMHILNFKSCKLVRTQVTAVLNLVLTKYSKRFCHEINKCKLFERLLFELCDSPPPTKAIKKTTMESVKMN